MFIAKDEEDIEILAEFIREGKLVAFPTETVYGLGTNALIKESVYRIYEVKGREERKPLSLHIGTLESLEELIELDPFTKRIIFNLLPGPINIIVRKKKDAPEWIGTQETLGIRFPSLFVSQKLLRIAKVPVVATSANLSGKEEPKDAKDVIEMIGDRIDAILDWGPVPLGIPSTVVNISKQGIEIIREGPISRERLEGIIEEIKIKTNLEGL